MKKQNNNVVAYRCVSVPHLWLILLLFLTSPAHSASVAELDALAEYVR